MPRDEMMHIDNTRNYKFVYLLFKFIAFQLFRILLALASHGCAGSYIGSYNFSQL